MDGDKIPESDHVARYVSPSKYFNKVLDWSALLPRQQDNGEASYNWLEYLGSGTVQELVACLRVSLTTLTVKKNGVFAALNVGRAISRMSGASGSTIQLSFIHTPRPGNDSHSSMFGLDHLNEAAGALLNDLCEKFPPG